MAPTWPSIIPLGATMSAPASRLGQGHALIELERGVVVDGAVAAEHAAVPVIGVLVETEIGDEHHRVAERAAQLRQRHLDDAVAVPGSGSHGIFLVGDPEQDDPGYPQ